MVQDNSHYYIPGPSIWPIVGAIGLFVTAVGAANWLHHVAIAPYIFLAGLLIMVLMMFGWFGAVIHESESGLYNLQVDRSYRWSMAWFIFSEVCFFAMFFGALFYARYYSVPSLGGETDHHFATHVLLWPDFKAAWPLFSNPDNTKYLGAYDSVPAWGLPAVNTLILLLSGVTITWAHHALRDKHRVQLIMGMSLTIALGLIFLYLQAHEYAEAYESFNLTLESGIYGATFYLLTGFHGFHVSLGTLMLMVILARCIRGHFTPDRHFAFEAVAWYWHFVDVVWLLLFILVYWM